MSSCNCGEKWPQKFGGCKCYKRTNMEHQGNMSDILYPTKKQVVQVTEEESLAVPAVTTS